MKDSAMETLFTRYVDEMIDFIQKSIQIRSYSDEEGEFAHFLLQQMKMLGFEEVLIDDVGNVVGRIGSGKKIIHFDSHLDTVQVMDAEQWQVSPFSGKIIDGKLYGRGSVDMKSALGASVYAAALAKQLGYLENKTVYVTGSICEEYCDGENLKRFYQQFNLKPDYVIICEPSNNLICLGHKGKAQLRITTHGISAHGSAPEKGVNAVYEMAEIIRRVETLNQKLCAVPGSHGTVVLSDISCVSASLNAVPSECSIYLDRRLPWGETLNRVEAEMQQLISDKNASWEVGTLYHTTWKGAKLAYQPMHNPWRIEPTHELTKVCNEAYQTVFGNLPAQYEFWDFGTNAITPVGMGIPTIGFGPGDYKLAHMRDENCEISQINDACRMYLQIIKKL